MTAIDCLRQQRSLEQRCHDFMRDPERLALIQMKGDLLLRRGFTISAAGVIYDPPTSQEAEVEQAIDELLAYIKAGYFSDKGPR
jgi:hypothetical protein